MRFALIHVAELFGLFAFRFGISTSHVYTIFARFARRAAVKTFRTFLRHSTEKADTSSTINLGIGKDCSFLLIPRSPQRVAPGAENQDIAGCDSTSQFRLGQDLVFLPLMRAIPAPASNPPSFAPPPGYYFPLVPPYVDLASEQTRYFVLGFAQMVFWFPSFGPIWEDQSGPCTPTTGFISRLTSRLYIAER